jgi:copper resistance protein C
MPSAVPRDVRSTSVALLTGALLCAFGSGLSAPGAAARPAHLAADASLLPAHAKLLTSAPANGSTVRTADSVVLTFNEEPDENFVRMVVEGPGGAEASGEPEVRGRELRQPLMAGLAAGTHRVTYRIVSVDGHPISGTIAFTTTSSSTASPSPAPSSAPTTTAGPAGPAASTPPAALPDPAPVAQQSPTRWPWLVLGGMLLAVLAVLGVGAARRRPRVGGSRPPRGT